MLINNIHPRRLDDQRELVVPGDAAATLTFCIEHWIAFAKESIKDHGFFYVALSGGSTPKAIFERLCAPPYRDMIEWDKIHLFWSDERAVPPDDPDSNYHMAMQAGFAKMSIPPAHIHRMHAETHVDLNAHRYEHELKSALQGRSLDLVMLGMGEDGHTASLFPFTEGTQVVNRQVIENFIPEKRAWRMTFTFTCINAAKRACVYIIGGSKKDTLAKVLTAKDKIEDYPVLRVGTAHHPALWIADDAAAAEIIAIKEKAVHNTETI